MLNGLRASHPELTVDISVGADDDLLPALDAGRLDVASLYGRFSPADLRREVAHETEVMALLPADHPLADE
ncbi:hypothetical protein BA062_24880 [Prauserella flavalba]|uniref:LysR substrate-binding domain-containing protein n=1 Tax=Prauserella flavalba TaxID=1477506 RepID=A0A318LMP3_9PSEU|nr:hypothetical protein BA062_24880 [Prauserella flavalba]